MQSRIKKRKAFEKAGSIGQETPMPATQKGKFYA